MSKIELRETMRAELKPDVYGGKTHDQIVPRWWCYGVGDMDGDYEHGPLSLDPRHFPPGTKISIEEPSCPECEMVREPITPRPESGPSFSAKCSCGFDWDEWTSNEYS